MTGRLDEVMSTIKWSVNHNEKAKFALSCSVPKHVVEHIYMAGAKDYADVWEQKLAENIAKKKADDQAYSDKVDVLLTWMIVILGWVLAISLTSIYPWQGLYFMTLVSICFGLWRAEENR